MSANIIASEPIALAVNDSPTAGPLTYYRHDIHDQVAEVKQSRTVLPSAPYEQTRTFTRNALGYLISEAQPESGVTTYGSFTALGLPKEKSNGGLTTKSEHDPLGRVLRVYDTEVDDDTEVDHIVNTYDQNSAAGASQQGKLTTSVGTNTYPSIGYADSFYPGGTITDSFTYAGLGGRLSEKRTSLSNGTVSAVTRWSYNNFGLVLDEAHPRIDPTYPTPFTTTTTYTAGFPTRVAVGTQPVVSSVKYNPAGGLASYTSGNSITTTIAPDPRGMARPSRISTSSGGFDTGLYTYDGAGNILKTGSDTFTYDAASRLLSANLGSSPQNYSYDGWGNLVSKAGTVIPVTKETNRLTNASYDLRGNVEGLGAERYRYDFLGRQVRHDNDVASTHLSYLFDAANERIIRAVPPPPHAPGAPAVLRREMVRIILQMMNQAPSATYADSFDDVPLWDPERGWIERAYELELAVGTSTNPPLFSPDNPLNRAEMAVFIASGMTYPGYNIPAFGTAQGLPFDCRPDSPTKHSLFGDVPPDHWACRFIHYVYDHQVTSGCTVGTLNYCPHESINHWQMQVMVSSAWPGSAYVPPGSSYTFRGLSGQVLTEFEDTVAARSSGYVTQDHVYLGSRLVGTKAGSAWLFHSTDHLGSVRLTTNLSQAVVASRKYWPWGEDMAPSGALALGFAGMERDMETEYSKPRYYDHARSLETGYGRFLSPDMLSGTVEDPLSWNRYTYARNNPLKYVDPDGRAAAAPGAVAAMVARRAFLGAALGAGVRLAINRGIQLSGHPEYKIWTGVQGAALTGAITGGANARTMTAKFVSNIAGVVAGNVWEGKKAGHSFEQLKTDALNGLAVGALSGGLDSTLSARIATGVASAPAVVSEHVDSVVGAIVSTATSASQEAGTGILSLFDEIRAALPGRKPEEKPEERPEKKAPTE